MELTPKERVRYETIEAVLKRRLTVEAAAEVLGTSVRQAYRLLARVRKEGSEGVAHKSRGRSTLNREELKTWERVIEIVRAESHEATDREIQEMLKRDHNIDVGRESLRKHLRAAGIGPKRKRRSAEPTLRGPGKRHRTRSPQHGIPEAHPTTRTGPAPR